ncbi:hypothetical protein [Pedobacter jeongneungensis]|uniref:hypothetical protein n=1 Tax=Pedobacter jeongneungensis TaxID=947309 RepID=UPI00046A3D73|nr:hypothetical protein [Pedobacter jeongneungensis]
MSEKFEIITRIKPLFDELINQKFISYLEKPEFVRACNRLEIDSEYTNAFNKAVELGKNDFFNFSANGIDYSDFLPDFLNQLYTNRREHFAGIISELLINDLACAKRLIILDSILEDLKTLGLSSQQHSDLIKAFDQYDRNLLLKAELLVGILLERVVQGGGKMETTIITFGLL